LDLKHEREIQREKEEKKKKEEDWSDSVFVSKKPTSVSSSLSDPTPKSSDQLSKEEKCLLVFFVLICLIIA
jgi:hypothetical protein